MATLNNQELPFDIFSKFIAIPLHWMLIVFMESKEPDLSTKSIIPSIYNSLKKIKRNLKALGVVCDYEEIQEALKQFSNFIKLSQDKTYLIFFDEGLAFKELSKLAGDLIQKAAKETV